MSKKILSQNVQSPNSEENDSLTVHKNWKKISMILLILFTVAAGYIAVEMQSEDEVPASVVKYHLSEFVMNMRSISSDPVMLRHLLEKAYAFTTLKGKKQLDKILQGINLKDKISRQITVTVQITSVKQKHKTLYALAWTETEYQNFQNSISVNL